MEADNLRFKSDYARRMATEEDAEDRDLQIKARRLAGSLGGCGANSLRRTDSESMLSSNRDGLLKSRFASNMSGSIGCLPDEVDHDVEQWVSSTLFRDILDVKERKMKVGQLQQSTSSSRPLPERSLPATEISRVETVVSINKEESSSPHWSALPANSISRRATTNEESSFPHWSALPANEISRIDTEVSINKQESSSPLQFEELQRENQQLRRQLSNLESAINIENVGGREGFQELQLEIAKLQNKIEKMESSKELYETSTQRLATFLEAFTSRLSVTSPKSIQSPKLKRQSARGNINQPRWDLEDSSDSYGTMPGEMDKRSSIGSYTSSRTSGYSTLPSREQTTNLHVARRESFRTLLGTKSLRGSDINHTSRGVNRREMIRNRLPTRTNEYKLPSSRPRVMMGSNSFVSRRSSFESRSRRAIMSTADLPCKAGDDKSSGDFNNGHLGDGGQLTDNLRAKGQQPTYRQISEQPIYYSHSLSFSSGRSDSSNAPDDQDADSLYSKVAGHDKNNICLLNGESQFKDESKVKKFLTHIKNLVSKEKSIKSGVHAKMDISSAHEVKESKVTGNGNEKLVEESKAVIKVGGKMPRSVSSNSIGTPKKARRMPYQHSTPNLESRTQNKEPRMGQQHSMSTRNQAKVSSSGSVKLIVPFSDEF